MQVLVFRFSALGDIALAVPVLQNIIENNPDAEITFVSRGFTKSILSPLKVNFISADLNQKHKGIFGLFKLFRELKRDTRPTIVIDLHQVLRTKVLNLFFKISGTPVYKIDKGRKAKKLLTQKENKKLKALQHTTLRYVEVFKKAGLKSDFDPNKSFRLEYPSNKIAILKIGTKPKIGIAPFAQHKGKSLPLSRIKELLDLLEDRAYDVYLFGGPKEKDKLDALKNKNPNRINTAGIGNLSSEISLMHDLDLMIAMDSSNMHLAILAGLKVVSIWGATHSFAGFGPLAENENYKVEVSTEHLTCRPCSVYGNKPCFRGDYACLEGITAASIMVKVEQVLKENTMDDA